MPRAGEGASGSSFPGCMAQVPVDKVSGFVSRAAVAEINKFLYEKCKEEGVEIAT